MKPRVEGYSIKTWTMQQWICSNGYTQSHIAKLLGLSTEDFTKKLYEHGKFNEYQVCMLIELMKAQDAFKVLYFPTMKMRRRIYKEVFG